MRINNKTKTRVLTAVALSFALILSACVAEEPAGETVTTLKPTTEAPTTTEPAPDPRLLFVPECDDSFECEAGFELAEVFYSVDCIAINAEFVTDETLGEGDYLGVDVTANVVQGVDPTSFVAISLPGGECLDGDVSTSAWSIAFDGQPTFADRRALCEVALLTEAQLIANACIGQLIPTTGEALPPETIEEIDRAMRSFLAVLPTDNVAARELWSGFPTPASKNTLFARFVRDFDWIKTRTGLRMEIVRAPGPTGSAVVVVTDDSDQGASFIVSPSAEGSPATIQRLPQPGLGLFVPSDRSVISGGNLIVFSGVSTGEVKAFLAGTELPQSAVTRAGGTVRVQLPEVLSPLVLVTITSESTEVPTTATAVYFYRP